jgi:glycosyltransferase involved in cell wall biosynthesis
MPRITVWQVVPHLALGGATKVVLWLAKGLDRERFAVTVVAGTEEKAEGSLQGGLAAAGAEFIPLPALRRDIAPRADWAAWRELRRLLRERRPDIVHAHGSKALILAGLAARGTGVRAIHTAHGWSFHDHQGGASRWLQVALHRAALRPAAAIVAVSAATRDKGLAAGIGRPEQYRVVYPGAELDEFEVAPGVRDAVRAELGLPEEALVVGSVMRLCDQKAPLDFVAAAQQVAAQCQQARFLVVGGGPLEGAVRAAVAGAGLDGSLILTGPRDDVPRLLAACDVFALSSLWEGLPIVYAEASAAGLPCVGTEVDGAAEVIEPGVTGLLTPPGDPQALADGILQVISAPDAARQMGTNGRRKVRAMGFAVADVVARYEALYHQVAGR